MRPGLQHAGTGVTTSALVRLLAGLAPMTEASPSGAPSGPGAAAPSGLLGERLAGWLDWTDAIALAGVLNPAPEALPAAAGEAPARLARQAAAELAHVRQDLGQAVQADALLAPPAAAVRRPGLPPNTPAMDDDSDFSLYRTTYAAHQRNMADRIGALRERLRALLGRGTPAQARLAALDGVMESVLALRERHLLAKLPALLEPRWQHWQAQPGPWRQHFGAELQALLLAELDLRLQPAEGLVEALATPDQPSL